MPPAFEITWTICRCRAEGEFWRLAAGATDAVSGHTHEALVVGTERRPIILLYSAHIVEAVKGG
jgi:hypothetical protein